MAQKIYLDDDGNEINESAEKPEPIYLDDNGEEIKKPGQLSKIPNPQQYEAALGDGRNSFDKAVDTLFGAPKVITEGAAKLGKKLFPVDDRQQLPDGMPEKYRNDPKVVESLNYMKAAGQGFKSGSLEGASELATPANALQLATGTKPLGMAANIGLAGLQGYQGANQISEGDTWSGIGNFAMSALALAAMGRAPKLPNRKVNVGDVIDVAPPLQLGPAPDRIVNPPKFFPVPTKPVSPSGNLGLRTPTGPLREPYNLIPNALADKLRAPSTNETVFNALLPRSLGGQRDVEKSSIDTKSGVTSEQLGKLELLSNNRVITKVKEPISQQLRALEQSSNAPLGDVRDFGRKHSDLPEFVDKAPLQPIVRTKKVTDELPLNRMILKSDLNGPIGQELLAKGYVVDEPITTPGFENLVALKYVKPLISVKSKNQTSIIIDGKELTPDEVEARLKFNDDDIQFSRVIKPNVNNEPTPQETLVKLRDLKTAYGALQDFDNRTPEMRALDVPLNEQPTVDTPIEPTLKSITQNKPIEREDPLVAAERNIRQQYGLDIASADKAVKQLHKMAGRTSNASRGLHIDDIKVQPGTLRKQLTDIPTSSQLPRIAGRTDTPLLNPVNKPSGDRTKINKSLPLEQQDRIAHGEKVADLSNVNYQGKVMVYNLNGPGNHWRTTLDEALKIDPQSGLKPINNPDEPQFARVGPGEIKVGLDGMSGGNAIEAAKRIIRTTSRAKYSGHVSGAATKELIQNARDATNHLGAGRAINITLENYVENGIPIKRITVKDNGPGLDLPDLETLYTDIYKSGKAGDIEAIGKFGIGKGSYLIGGDYVSVTSVVNNSNGTLTEWHFEGNPESLMERVPITSQDVPFGPTGITTTVTIPANESMYEADVYIHNFKEHSYGAQGQLTINRTSQSYNDAWTALDPNKPPSYSSETIILGQQNLPKELSVIQHDANTTLDIRYVKNTSMNKASYVKAHFLNRGIYQGSETISIRNEKGQTVASATPYEITVNVLSDASEQGTNYPWTENRESLRNDFKETIGKEIYKVIGQPMAQEQANKMQVLYDAMPSYKLPSGANFYVHDSGGRYTPDEIAEFMANPHVIQMAESIHKTTTDYLQKIAAGNPNFDWTKKVERIGFVFTDTGIGDDYTKGIWIPHPAINRGHATILINPMALMAHLKTPDMAVAGIEHTIIHEIAHNAPVPLGEDAHGITHIYTVSKLIELIGAKNAAEVKSHFQQITTGSRDGEQYLPEIQELLQGYLESRRRPEVTKDPLGASGIGSKYTKDGTSDIPEDARSNEQRAIEQLNLAIKDAPALRELQEASYSIERAARMKAANRVKTTGERGFYKRLKKLQGEYEKIEFNPELVIEQSDRDTLRDIIQKSTLQDWEKIRASTALFKVLNGAELPQRAELVLLQRVFGQEVVDNIIEMHGGLGAIGNGIQNLTGAKIIRTASEIASFTKTVKSALDFSALFRQGLPLIHRVEYWQAAAEMFKYAFSQDKFDDAQNAIRNRKFAALGEVAGLSLTDIGKNLENREEQFMSVFAEKWIPGVKMSNRAYTGFLNHLRAGVFDALVEDTLKMGLDPLKDAHLVKSLARFVNNATGRGTLNVGPIVERKGNVIPGKYDSTGKPLRGKSTYSNWIQGEKIAVELNTIFFSPKFISSRLQVFNPWYYKQLHPVARKEAIRSMLAWVSAASTILGLAYMAGADIETEESTSPDFLKARWGPIRIDPWAGLQPNVVAFSKLWQMKSTSSTSGITTPFGSTYTSSSWLKTGGNWARSKLSPVAGFLVSVMNNFRDQAGNEMSFEPVTELIETGTIEPKPFMENLDIFQNNAIVKEVEFMFTQDLYNAIKESPEIYMGVLTSLFSFLGGGTNVYDRGPDKTRGPALRPIQPNRPLRPLKPRGEPNQPSR